MFISSVKNSMNFEGHRPQALIDLMAQMHDTDSITGMTETLVKQNRSLNTLSTDVITKIAVGRNVNGGLTFVIVGDVVDLKTNETRKKYFSQPINLGKPKDSINGYLKLVEQEISKLGETLTENIGRRTGKTISSIKEQILGIKGGDRAEQIKDILFKSYARLFGE